MKITQPNRVLNYLKLHGGIATSNELRSALGIVDIPKSVSLLNKRGYQITAERRKDGTATYTLGEKRTIQRKIIFEGNKAIIIDG